MMTAVIIGSFALTTGAFYVGMYHLVKDSHIHQRNALFHYVEKQLSFGDFSLSIGLPRQR